MNLIQTINEAANNSDVEKLVAQYKEMLEKGEVKQDKIADMIGDDLEMLEYSPEEVEEMLPQILAKVSDVE